ncbi:MAG: hypothetical protein WC704_07435 [Sphingomonas sp.]
MHIGVVCEGPTDYPAIICFFGEALKARDINATFNALFPEMDRTRPEAGWANVLLWLKNNPPAKRIQQYFGGGLFGGNLSGEQYDAIIIHLDTDIIEHESFINFARESYNYNISTGGDCEARAAEISAVIQIAADFNSMTQRDQSRHVPTPAVESTENWCVAAFHGQPENFELIRGNELTNRFMAALEMSESRSPQDQYTNVDKDNNRRKRFCERHAGGASRVISGCKQFASALDKLAAIQPTPS